MNKKKILKNTGITILILFLITQLGTILTIGEIIYLNSVEITELKVSNNTLYINNEINVKTPDQIRTVFAQNPQIDTIYLEDVPGSVDDDANLEIATWIANKNLTMKIGKDSYIASGGTDFFLAGKTRIIENGAQVGVHSWGGFTTTAKDYPVGHEYHMPYIDYYQKIGWSLEDSEKFYYFTINAAPAHDIYIMTNQELIDYKLTTENLIRE